MDTPLFIPLGPGHEAPGGQVSQGYFTSLSRVSPTSSSMNYFQFPGTQHRGAERSQELRLGVPAAPSVGQAAELTDQGL